VSGKYVLGKNIGQLPRQGPYPTMKSSRWPGTVQAMHYGLLELLRSGVRVGVPVQRERAHGARAAVRELIDIALSSPAERGLPSSAWTRGLLPPIPMNGSR
jgi:hypothetical protein